MLVRTHALSEMTISSVTDELYKFLWLRPCISKFRCYLISSNQDVAWRYRHRIILTSQQLPCHLYRETWLWTLTAKVIPTLTKSVLTFILGKIMLLQRTSLHIFLYTLAKTFIAKPWIQVRRRILSTITEQNVQVVCRWRCWGFLNIGPNCFWLQEIPV